METPFRVNCPTHGEQYLSELSYRCQSNDRQDEYWRCPKCWKKAPLDDEWFAEKIGNYKWIDAPLEHHLALQVEVTKHMDVEAWKDDFRNGETEEA